MQKALDFLLKKYSVTSVATLSADNKRVTVDGEDIGLLPFESERRFVELRGLVLAGRVGNMCTYRIGNTSPRTSDLMDVLYREAGIVEFTINSRIKEVFAIAGGNAMNCIVETENGCVCTLELAATLNEGDAPIDKHEIITDSGVACDRVVDTQVPQSSVYVFGKKSAEYTDTDAELYGYSECEINRIRNAFMLAKNPEARAEYKAKEKHLLAVVEAAKKSLETLENVVVEG